MTFLEYFWYIDVPVSILVFIIILVVLNKRRKKRRLEAISEELLDEYRDAYDDLAYDDYDTYDDLSEEDFTESNFMSSPANLEAKQFPKWLLDKASYKQLHDFVINSQLKNAKFHLSDYTWNEAKRLVAKLEKLQLKEYGNEKSVVSELINDLRYYMDFWA